MKKSIYTKIAIIFSLSLASSFISSIAFAESESAQDAKAISRAMDEFKSEAMKLSPSEIYQHLKSALEIRSLFAKPGFDPTLIYNKDVQRSTGYAMALAEKSKSGEPEAAFFYGLYKSAECNGIRNISQNSELSSLLSRCYDEVISNFKTAAASDIASAAYNVAIMYSKGMGVPASKYAAADWYIKACELHLKNGQRDEALSALEEAISLVPDHPKALKLRSELLK